MTARIILTDAYDDALSKIEDFVYGQAIDVLAVQNFLRAHDEALRFISENPCSPTVHPKPGDQSWFFGEGRYRVIFMHIDFK